MNIPGPVKQAQKSAIQLNSAVAGFLNQAYLGGLAFGLGGSGASYPTVTGDVRNLGTNSSGGLLGLASAAASSSSSAASSSTPATSVSVGATGTTAASIVGGGNGSGVGGTIGPGVCGQFGGKSNDINMTLPALSIFSSCPYIYECRKYFLS
ncbi:unnamed protein product [Protopolystoma xenopodis]|uniref:Uncharacterized protein n=1 Tax=Protopolystoma xenopodis TaxID=117903 RepID=A0A3S5BNN3_9PLAT|nr:unnamed protein product [Protopolystoma xenopodis]